MSKKSIDDQVVLDFILAIIGAGMALVALVLLFLSTIKGVLFFPCVVVGWFSYLCFKPAIKRRGL